MLLKPRFMHKDILDTTWSHHYFKFKDWMWEVQQYQVMYTLYQQAKSLKQQPTDLYGIFLDCLLLIIQLFGKVDDSLCFRPTVGLQR